MRAGKVKLQCNSKPKVNPPSQQKGVAPYMNPPNAECEIICERCNDWGYVSSWDAEGRHDTACTCEQGQKYKKSMQDNLALASFVHDRLLNQHSGGAKLSEILAEVITVCWRQTLPREPLDALLHAINLDRRLGVLEYSWPLSMELSRAKFFVYIK